MHGQQNIKKKEHSYVSLQQRKIYMNTYLCFTVTAYINML